MVVVWLLLAVLVGAIVVIESRDRFGPKSGRGSPNDPRWLLPVPADQLGAVEVANAGRRHRFERDAAGGWFYHGAHTGAEGAHTHTVDPAVAQRIGRTVAAFGRTRVERELAVDRDAKGYGVTPPQILILIYRPQESQPLAQYAVGDIAPDTVSRYVQMVGQPSVMTIPSYQIDNLAALIEAVAPSASQGPAGVPSAR